MQFYASCLHKGALVIVPVYAKYCTYRHYDYDYEYCLQSKKSIVDWIY